MIDWVTAKIPCLHLPIKAGQVMKLTPEGEIEWSTVCRTSVTGSFDNRLSVRSQGSDGEGHATTLHISGNPAKYLQGHNIVGSDNVIKLVQMAVQRAVHTLIDEGMATPFLENSVDWGAIANGDFEIDRVDINYLYELPSRSDVNAWLRAAEYCSHTRHGRPRNDGGTVYWGKQSRRWSLKAYSKAREIEGKGMHKLPDEEYFKKRNLSLPWNFKPLQKLKDWVQNKLRIEAVIRQMELREQGIKYARDLTPERVQNLYSQYVGRIEMAEKVLLNDEQALKLPRAAAATYHMWKIGMVPADMLPRNTFYRHRRQLLEHGIDISNPPPIASGSNVVPLIRVLEAKPVQIPEWVYESGLIVAA